MFSLNGNAFSDELFGVFEGIADNAEAWKVGGVSSPSAVVTLLVNDQIGSQKGLSVLNHSSSFTPNSHSAWCLASSSVR